MWVTAALNQTFYRTIDDERNAALYAVGNKSKAGPQDAARTAMENHMGQYPRIYTIHIRGQLHERWKNWFDGMTVRNLGNGEAVIEGMVQDQSVLVGIINQIHGLNLTLISVRCNEEDS